MLLIGRVKASNGAREVEPDLYKHTLKCHLDYKWKMSGYVFFCTSLGLKFSFSVILLLKWRFILENSSWCSRTSDKAGSSCEAKSQSVLGFRRPATAAESSQGPLPGGVSFQPKEGRERGRGAARPGMRSPGQRDGVRPLSFGIRGRNRPGCFGSHRTWPRQNAACSEGAAPPGQRWGGPAPRGAPPPMMRRPPTGPRPVTHSSPWLQHKATSPGGRFLPEERLQRPRRR